MVKLSFDYKTLSLSPDLHSHSTYSDGTLAPEALVARAADRGLKVLALTDHDDTSGLASAQTAAQALGLTLVNGVEISVTWRSHTIHVVGLNIDPANAALQTGLAATRGGRHRRAEKISAALDDVGIAGSREGIKEFAANADMVSRTHFARFLVKCGAVKNMQVAFNRYLGAGQPCFVPHQWAGLEDAVGWIKNSGGVAVIAHPGRYPLDNAQMRELLAEFSEHGGAAIEIITSSHKPQQAAHFAAYAQKFGLAASAGSDFHSPQESYFDLGSLPALPPGTTPVWQMLGL
ncbi:MAG: phosphatase [Betaproteobacteria bacterium]|nr:phosphatase [Betaproteobacteria bacterium]